MYNATEQEMYALSQNYNIADLAYGNIGGKGSLKLRKIENRLKAIQYLAKNSAASDIKLAYNILENKSKSKYWKYLMNDTSRNLSEESINTTKSVLDVYLNQYISGKNEIVEAAIPAGKENLETIASAMQERSLAGVSRGKTIIATMALLAAMGLSLFTGAVVKGCYDNRIIKEKESRIEQLVRENNKPRMIIKTSLSAEEMNKRYEKYAADEKAGRLPVLDLAQSKEEGTEYYANKGCNKGIFVQGYMHATNKMEVPPEFSEEELKEKERLQKKWANIGEKVNRDAKKLGSGLYDTVRLKHPIGGPLRAISGFGGILNASARGFVRPITYFLTRSDTLDKAIDDFADASYFGDSYNELHGNILGLKFQKTGDFVKEHPVKSTISIAEDILPFLIKDGHGGDGESGASTSGGGSVPGIPGRSGGAGNP